MGTAAGTPSSALLSCELNLPVQLKVRPPSSLSPRCVEPLLEAEVRCAVAQVEGLMGHLQGAEGREGKAGRANPVDVFITLQLAAHGTFYKEGGLRPSHPPAPIPCRGVTVFTGAR
jgi:hypothetical protein